MTESKIIEITIKLSELEPILKRIGGLPKADAIRRVRCEKYNTRLLAQLRDLRHIDPTITIGRLVSNLRVVKEKIKETTDFLECSVYGRMHIRILSQIAYTNNVPKDEYLESLWTTIEQYPNQPAVIIPIIEHLKEEYNTMWVLIAFSGDKFWWYGAFTTLAVARNNALAFRQNCHVPFHEMIYAIEVSCWDLNIVEFSNRDNPPGFETEERTLKRKRTGFLTGRKYGMSYDMRPVIRNMTYNIRKWFGTKNLHVVSGNTPFIGCHV